MSGHDDQGGHRGVKLNCNMIKVSVKPHMLKPWRQLITPAQLIAEIGEVSIRKGHTSCFVVSDLDRL